jgi:hypothetical protein
MIGACVVFAACDSLTDVEAPDIVEPGQLDNPQGADAWTSAAISELYSSFVTFVFNSGRFSDEFFIATPFTAFADVDYRTQSLTFTEYGPITMHRARLLAGLGIESRQQYLPEPRARIGQLFAVKGFTELFLGETSCNGTPLSDVVNFVAEFGGPISSDSMTRRAVADFDSAVAYAADSARILNFARIGRARALTNLGRYADAAATVAAVPTSYVYNAELTTSAGGTTNAVWNINNTGGITVSNREGTNGYDYVDAQDPRVPTTFLRTGTDGLTPVHLFTKYTGLGSPIPIATGIEARLIEAEAALQANPGSTGWLDILNTLRATQVTPAMPALADPGTAAARVELLFRERAFWLYATGHRMGDMRRLLRQYGRNHDSVYPIGPYKAGQDYGEDVVFILTLSEQSNPNGRTCTDKNP